MTRTDAREWPRDERGMIIATYEEAVRAELAADEPPAPSDEPAPAADEVRRPARMLGVGERRTMGELLGTSPKARTLEAEKLAPGARLARAAVVVGVLVGLAVAVALAERAAPAPQTARLASVPSATRAPATPTRAPSSGALMGVPLGRAVVAYDAPDGRALGALDGATVYTPTGDMRDGWAQVDASGGAGRVWVRALDVPAVPTATAQPSATPAPSSTPAPATRPAVAAPAAPAAAEVCVTVNMPDGRSATRCAATVAEARDAAADALGQRPLTVIPIP